MALRLDQMQLNQLHALATTLVTDGNEQQRGLNPSEGFIVGLSMLCCATGEIAHGDALIDIHLLN